MMIYNHFEQCLKNGNVINENGTVLELASESVSNFILSEEVRVALIDDELFTEFYKQVNEFQNAEENGWGIWYEEHDKKLMYK